MEILFEWIMFEWSPEAEEVAEGLSEGAGKTEEGRREVRVVGAAGHMELGLSLALLELE